MVPPALCDDDLVIEDFERCYRAVQSRDARFDGWFFVGVTSTGISFSAPACGSTVRRAGSSCRSAMRAETPTEDA